MYDRELSFIRNGVLSVIATTSGPIAYIREDHFEKTGITVNFREKGEYKVTISNKKVTVKKEN